MLRKFKKDPKLQEAIDQALIELMRDHAPHEDDYAKAVDQIQKLHKLKEAEKPLTVSPDALVSAAATIASIMLIIKHEEFNAIATKAIGFVPKPRI